METFKSDTEEQMLLDVLQRAECLFGILTARLRETLALYPWYRLHNGRVPPDIQARAHRQLLDVVGALEVVAPPLPTEVSAVRELRARRDAEIQAAWNTGQYTQRSLANRFQLSRQMIHAILKKGRSKNEDRSGPGAHADVSDVVYLGDDPATARPDLSSS